MIDKMIKAVDEGFSHDGIGSVPEMVPVDVRHWAGPAIFLRNKAVRAAQLLPGLVVDLVHGKVPAVPQRENR